MALQATQVSRHRRSVLPSSAQWSCCLAHHQTPNPAGSALSLLQLNHKTAPGRSQLSLPPGTQDRESDQISVSYSGQKLWENVSHCWVFHYCGSGPGWGWRSDLECNWAQNSDWHHEQDLFLEEKMRMSFQSLTARATCSHSPKTAGGGDSAPSSQSGSAAPGPASPAASGLGGPPPSRTGPAHRTLWNSHLAWPATSHHWSSSPGGTAPLALSQSFCPSLRTRNHTPPRCTRALEESSRLCQPSSFSNIHLSERTLCHIVALWLVGSMQLFLFNWGRE